MPSAAVCIGMTYPPEHETGASELKGCIVDAMRMCNFARSLGIDNVNVLTDRLGFPLTKDQVRSALANMIVNAEEGDFLMFYYSGHGGSIEAEDSDEGDGKDECIFLSDGPMIDNEIKEWLLEIPEGVRVLLIFDSCHSGTVADLESGAQTAAEIVCLSSATDEQVCLGGMNGSAFTNSLIHVILEHTSESWRQIMRRVDAIDGQQSANVTASHPELLDSTWFTTQGSDHALEDYESYESQRVGGKKPAGEGRNKRQQGSVAAAAESVGRMRISRESDEDEEEEYYEEYEEVVEEEEHEEEEEEEEEEEDEEEEEYDEEEEEEEDE